MEAVQNINDLTNEIILTHVKTSMRLLTLGEDGVNAFTLYNFYAFVATRQETTHIKATNAYCIKGLHWGEEKFLRAKKILNDLGIVEDIIRRNKHGRIEGHYINVHYLKRTRTPQNQALVPPEPGFQPPNALDIHINTIEKQRSTYRSAELLIDIPKEMLEELVNTYKASEFQVLKKARDLYRYCETHGKTYKNYRMFLENALDKDFGERDAVQTKKKKSWEEFVGEGGFGK